MVTRIYIYYLGDELPSTLQDDTSNSVSIPFLSIHKKDFEKVVTELKKAPGDLPPEALIWVDDTIKMWKELSVEEKERWYKETYPECFTE